MATPSGLAWASEVMLLRLLRRKTDLDKGREPTTLQAKVIEVLFLDLYRPGVVQAIKANGAVNTVFKKKEYRLPLNYSTRVHT
jgi:hypothetical protein